MSKVFIIAEAGVNHNGSVDVAKRMIEAAAVAGADAVKFQTFKAGQLVSENAPKAEYQKKGANSAESQRDMVKRLELDEDAHKELISHCAKSGILFLSSPFDLESIELLTRLGIDMFKVPSGEITNPPYLKKLGGLKKKIIMSTGMADMDEIKTALDILTKAGTLKENITVLHCNTEYPTPIEDVNLSAMCAIKDSFRINVGYSDHTLGREVPIAAVALGASIIEKHFTLDRNMEGPDHKASMEPSELKEMISAVRGIEKSLGDGIKRPTRSELKNRDVVRKGIVASRPIKKAKSLLKKTLPQKGR